MDNQNCKGCGMPMGSDKDHGGGNSENPYCKHCCDESGKVYPREERVRNMAKFMMQQNGMAEEEATRAAEEKIPKED
jgi:hypothetical protein